MPLVIFLMVSDQLVIVEESDVAISFEVFLILGNSQPTSVEERDFIKSTIGVIIEEPSSHSDLNNSRLDIIYSLMDCIVGSNGLNTSLILPPISLPI